MINAVDSFLNKITMYRLLAYYLGGLVAVATAFSAAGILPYDPVALLTSTAFLASVCWLFNYVIARIWETPTNSESALITALILALIITPERPDVSFFFLFWAAVIAMASKYIIAIRAKHLFNPAALAVAITALVLDQPATWWVGGNIPMLPFVLVGGFLIVRKIRRTDLALSFLAAAIVSSLAPIFINGGDVLTTFSRTLVHTPLFFFAFVMITEPLTMPPRRPGRIAYGLFVGALFAPWVNIASFYFTPELALLAGNVLSYALSPKFKMLLKLKEKVLLADNAYEFVFDASGHTFIPGQYAEWTIPADSSDSRGNRRFFTISSAPNDPEIRVGIKLYPNPSTFKKRLSELVAGDTVLAGNIAGDFTMPNNTAQKLVFIAGGIGVTPFISMIRSLDDTKQKRDIVFLYGNAKESEIAYKDLIDAVAQATGVRVVYALSDKAVPEIWQGERGFVNAAMITRHVPDYTDRLFYISGPNSMVSAVSSELKSLGVARNRIKKDFFPGFA